MLPLLNISLLLIFNGVSGVDVVLQSWAQVPHSADIEATTVDYPQVTYRQCLLRDGWKVILVGLGRYPGHGSSPNTRR